MLCYLILADFIYFPLIIIYRDVFTFIEEKNCLKRPKGRVRSGPLVVGGREQEALSSTPWPTSLLSQSEWWKSEEKHCKLQVQRETMNPNVRRFLGFQSGYLLGGRSFNAPSPHFFTVVAPMI